MNDQHRADRPIHAIIPAGGAGTRLWPLSRRARPKFLLDLTGAGRSLLQGTVARLEPVAASISVVTGAAHLAAVADQLPGLGTGCRSQKNNRKKKVPHSNSTNSLDYTRSRPYTRTTPSLT